MLNCRAVRWRIDDVNDSNLFNHWHAVCLCGYVSLWFVLKQLFCFMIDEAMTLMTVKWYQGHSSTFHHCSNSRSSNTVSMLKIARASWQSRSVFVAAVVVDMSETCWDTQHTFGYSHRWSTNSISFQILKFQWEFHHLMTAHFFLFISSLGIECTQWNVVRIVSGFGRSDMLAEMKGVVKRMNVVLRAPIR